MTFEFEIICYICDISHHTSKPMNMSGTDKGRILNGYRLVYISEGEGTLLDGKGKRAVSAGTVVLLRPGLRHSLRAKNGSAWVEHDVDFNGPELTATVRGLFPEDGHVILHTGLNDEVVSLMDSAVECTASGREYAGPLFTAIVNHLLVLTRFLSGRREGSDGKVQEAVRYAKAFLRDHLAAKVDLQRLADDLGMSYSWFRRVFREHTGTAPAQYLQALRIDRSKDLLLNTDKPVKAISAECGFTTPEYFCNVFRASTGSSPLSFREGLRGDRGR